MSAQAEVKNRSRASVEGVELAAVPPVIKSQERWISWRAWWAHVAGLFHWFFVEPRLVREVGPNSRPLERYEWEKPEYRSFPNV